MKKRKPPVEGWKQTSVVNTVIVHTGDGKQDQSIITVTVPAWKSKTGQIYYDDRALAAFDDIKRKARNGGKPC